MVKTDFGWAVKLLKRGKKLRRAGWNGKGMYIYLYEGTSFTIDGQTRTFEPYLMMYTAQGKFQPGWLASQADILAEDWELVSE